MKNRALWIAALVMLLNGCSPRDESKIRRYTEVETSAPPPVRPSGMPDDEIHRGVRTRPDETATTPGSAALRWTAPAAWTEERGSGMRLAALRPPETNAVCTIVVLGGMAGGERANIVRWLGQVNLELAENELDDFLAAAAPLETAGGLIGRVYDFTTLSSDDDAASLLAAIFSLGRQSAFIKFTAPRATLLAYRDDFVLLCASLRDGGSE